MKRLLTVVLVAGLAACGGTDDGPKYLAHGIVAGNHQTVVAGNQRLGAGVTELLTMTADGKLSFHRVESRGEQLLDLVVPRAYAQTGTVVTGSPVPGAVVCAQGGDGGLVPFVQCTNTLSDGTATFFFTPSNVAGEHTSEIRGTVANAPAVFDTAKATVLPAPASPTYRLQNTIILTSPAVIPANAVQDAFGNAVPFRVVSDGRLTVQDTTVGTIAARTVVFDSTAYDGQHHAVELRGAGGVLVGRMDYLIGAEHPPGLQYKTAGVDLTP